MTIHKIESEVTDFLQKHKIENTCIVVGLSGGIDSSALLISLVNLQQQFNIIVVAVHINHQIRKSSIMDQLFCEQLCKKLQIQFVNKTINVKQKAKEQKISTETAGRNERYKLLYEVAKTDFKTNKLSVAHTANDDVETFLMRLISGTGIIGLTGIKEISTITSESGDYTLMRPLLNSYHSECLEYCQSKGVNPIRDPTNFSTEPFRNRIRLNVIPKLRRLNPNLVQSIKSTSEDLREILNIMKTQNPLTLKFDGNDAYLQSDLIKLNDTQIAFALQSILPCLSGDKRYKRLHYSLMIDQIRKQKKTTLMLPDEILFRITGGKVFFEKSTTKEKVCDKQTKTIDLSPVSIKPNSVILLPNNHNLETKFVLPKEVYFNEQKNVIFVSSKVADSTMRIRNIKKGDKFQPLGMEQEVEIAGFLKKQKIDQNLRQCQFVLENSTGIFWLIGQRIAEWAKVEKGDLNAIQFSYKESTN